MTNLRACGPSALGPEAGRETLTSWSQFKDHRKNRAKLDGYRRLCDDLAVDPDRLTLSQKTWEKDHERPRLIYAEQPGNWFYPEDVLRILLLKRLCEFGDFDTDSGPVSLSNDAFGHRGWKRCFIEFHLGCGLGPVNLIGSPFLRRRQGCSYGSLRISDSLYERMDSVLETCERLLIGADESPRGFLREVSVLFDRGVRDGLRGLLPTNRDRRSLENLRERLNECDLARAGASIRKARDLLYDGVPWPDFWDAVNQSFFDLKIGNFEKLSTPFVAAIRDPFQTAESLAEILHLDTDEPVVLVGLVAEENRYRLVCCDRKKKCFFLRCTSREDRPISWSEVLDHAEDGRVGGPSAVLKYLLMAASGLYLIADPLDGASEFEQQVARIHRRYTGLKFPWVSLPSGRENSRSDWLGSYLDLHHPDFDRHADSAIDAFFVQ